MPAQLYLISPPKIDLPAFRKELAVALSTAQSGLIGAFQLRLKEADDDTIRHAIKELMPVCRAHQVIFIINDRPDLCAEFQCDGVHVGQEDLLNSPLEGESKSANVMKRNSVGGDANKKIPPTLRASSHGSLSAAPPQGGSHRIAEIRNLIGEKAAIGVTCHASRHLAMEAGEAGADYVAFGAFYPTTSKPKEKLEKWGTPTPDLLQWWSTFTTVPCVAIGGITPQNALPLLKAGTDMIAVITSVWNHPKGVAAAMAEFADVLRG